MTPPIFPHLPNAQTQLLAVIGHPVNHSLSPSMHNPALAWMRINARYLALDIHPNHLETAVRGFASMGMLGFNATIPHKEKLIPLMDTLDPLAKRIGAVNTVHIKDGLLHGYNTDAQGFTDALFEQFPKQPTDKPVLILGAGGAARGVIVGLLEAGFKTINIANRTQQRAEQIQHDLTPYYPDATFNIFPLNQHYLPLESTQLLVNTTSIGLKEEKNHTIDMTRLPQSACVYDIVYAPETTPLLKSAHNQQLATLDGMGMLLHQGARAFEIWTQQKMDVQQVRSWLQHTM